jgi:hypothetical protein
LLGSSTLVLSSCHPDRSERSSLKRKDLGQLREAKPIPVPSLLIQFSCHPEGEVEGPEPALSIPEGRSDAPSLCHPERSLYLCVILTEASERSLRGRTSDSFAKAKPVPVPYLLIQKIRHPDRSERTLATRKDLGQLRESEAGTGSKSPHPTPVIAPYFLGSPFLHREGGQGVRFRTSNSKHRQSVILTEASERSLRGRAFLADSGGETRPLSAGVTPAEAGTGSSSLFCHPDRSERTLASRKDLGQLRESEAGSGSSSPHPKSPASKIARHSVILD